MSTINVNQSRNIVNSTTDYLKEHVVERAVVFMHDNTVETVINSVDTPEQVQGVFEYISNDGFSQGVNSITYSGNSMTAQAIAIFSADSTNNQELAFYISVNGNVVNDSEGFVTTDSGGKAVNIVSQTILDLKDGDDVSVMLENYTSTNNVTVDNLSINIISIH